MTAGIVGKPNSGKIRFAPATSNSGMSGIHRGSEEADAIVNGRLVVPVRAVRAVLLVATWRTALKHVDDEGLDLQGAREAFWERARAFMVAMVATWETLDHTLALATLLTD
eukprot:1176626-Prorocentrum_minimum.AAC.3